MKQLSSILSMSGLKLLNSVMGFGKNFLIARVIGVNQTSDAYFLALGFLNMFNCFFGLVSNTIVMPLMNREVSMSASPEVTRMRQQELLQFCATWLVIISLVCTVILSLGSDWIAQWFCSTESAGGNPEFKKMARYAMPICVVAQTTVVMSVVLIRRKQFSKINMPDLVSNIVFILLLLYLYPFVKQSFMELILVISQFVVAGMYFYYIKLPWKWRFQHNKSSEALKILPIAFGTWLISAIPGMVDNFYLSQTHSGFLSLFRYAGTMCMLATSITVLSMVTTSTPEILALLAHHKYDRLKKLLLQRSVHIFGMSIVVCVLGYFLSPFVLPKLFNTGKLSAKDLQELTLLFQINLLGVPTAAIFSIAQLIMNNLGYQVLGMVNSAISTVLRLVMCWYAFTYFDTMGLVYTFIVHNYIAAIIILGFTCYSFMQARKKHQSEAVSEITIV